jgi:hypothetical protein
MNNVFDWNRIGKKYDIRARTYAKLVWESKGIIAKDNPDQYDTDLILYRGVAVPSRKIAYCEVEMSDWWKSGPYRSNYDLVTCPERKGNGNMPSLKKKSDGLPVFWMQFNQAGTHFVAVLAERFLRNEPKEFPHGKNFNDRFYYVPIEESVRGEVPKV